MIPVRVGENKTRYLLSVREKQFGAEQIKTTVTVLIFFDVCAY